ncbi:MAG: hypothetical protein ABSA46_04710, partial [Thermodesulfovibrionales bacterium]
CRYQRSIKERRESLAYGYLLNVSTILCKVTFLDGLTGVSSRSAGNVLKGAALDKAWMVMGK